ncbi:MAG: hypothetical protein LLG06_02185 [Desulfobacteraceae bacterium]|nr:hypothetical protein [Desulfobacteraceae bacterium]
MSFEGGKVILRLFICTVCAISLFGCSTFELPKKEDFSSTWVSKSGKTRDDLMQDQKECRHEASLVTPPAFPGEMGGSGADMKVFNACMRSKGWVKE